MTDKMREQFEAYWRDRECYNAEEAKLWLSKEPCGGYTYRDPNEAWKVWQASRTATQVELPHLFPFYRQAVTDAILAQGARVIEWGGK